jgi:hypothetical protein
MHACAIRAAAIRLLLGGSGSNRAAQELCAWQRLAAEALHLFFVRRAVA